LAFLLFLVSLVAPSTAIAVPYRCLDDSKFTLIASPTLAVVRFADREYRLPRRPSSLAIKYGSTTATLYLDGEFAAFIAEDRPLPGCYREQQPGKRR
jgi:hypothetical protein